MIINETTINENENVSFSDCLESAIFDYVKESVDYDDCIQIDIFSDDELFEDFISYTNYFEDEEVSKRKGEIVKKIRYETEMLVDEILWSRN